MTSPSTSSRGSKRKRANGTRQDSSVEMLDQQLQPSSRDASGEEGDTTAPESGRHNLRSSAAGPNPKRQRSNSERNSAATFDAADQIIDPGEPSDTTEASDDIAERVGRKSRKSAAKENAIDDYKTESMAPPPIGKLTHPVGYQTNPPPVGRAVRVYADGVFDMFHLGSVTQVKLLHRGRLCSKSNF